LPEDSPQDVITGLDILFEPEEPEPPTTPSEPVPQKTGIWARATRPWRRANAAFASYFNHPEKGRRRQIAATLGFYAVLGATAWAVGHHLFGEHEHYGPPQPTTSIPTNPVPTPPVESPPMPQGVHDAPFYDNLYPTNYHGETFEWSTAANQFGPAYATHELQEMIDHARQSGVSVDVWGNTSGDRWGINSVTVPLDGGGYQTYYDTPHKLAILQYYSEG